MSKLFGGTNDSAQQAQIQANEAAQKFIEEQAALARTDVSRAFPRAREDLIRGQQGAADVIGSIFPEQVSAFQQGNLGAQAALLGGQQQMQNAILGLPVDMSGFQPQRIDIDTSLFQRDIPGYDPAAFERERFNQTDDIIRKAYQDVLKRDVDEGGLHSAREFLSGLGVTGYPTGSGESMLRDILARSEEGQALVAAEEAAAAKALADEQERQRLLNAWDGMGEGGGL